jgi:GWxTD domain-containing protein
VNFNYLLFAVPDETSYVELQFLFNGNGLAYRQTPQNTYQALIGVEICFIQKDTLIKHNYTFTGATYPDSLSEGKNNIYNVVRIPLPDGEYNMEMKIYDRNSFVLDTLSFRNRIKLHFISNTVSFSDIMPIASFTQAGKQDNFTKHGIEYLPYFSNFYPENIKQMTFMTEIYHTDSEIQGDDFLIHAYISPANDTTPVSPQYEHWSVAKTTEMYVVLQSFLMDSLPSGNYTLNLEVKDRKDTLHAYTSWYFQRSNPSIKDTMPTRTDSLSYDTLKLYLDYIYPIANYEERDFIKNISPQKYKEIEDFFNLFWYRRNPDKPSEEWYKYYNQVMRVNYNYSTLKFKGYRTDRGYYYLKYGPPSDIEYEHSTVNGPPYEIWTYYTMSDGQVNVMFVFYNADLTTKDFRLLHSTARGETQNKDWKKILYIDESSRNGEIELYEDK